jgi:hypothetical protein
MVHATQLTIFYQAITKKLAIYALKLIDSIEAPTMPQENVFQDHQQQAIALRVSN